MSNDRIEQCKADIANLTEELQRLEDEAKPKYHDWGHSYRTAWECRRQQRDYLCRCLNNIFDDYKGRQ